MSGDQQGAIRAAASSASPADQCRILGVATESGVREVLQHLDERAGQRAVGAPTAAAPG